MKKLSLLLYLAIAVGLSLLRIFTYGSPKLSINALDTGSYIHVSRQPQIISLSWFTAKRSFTLPFIYRLLQGDQGYQTIAISEPAIPGSPNHLVFQPGFDRVAVFQWIVSLLSWNLLAFVIYRRMYNPIVGCIGAFLTLAFAFAPQMAEWDRIMMSESLSFSLFAAELALIIELAQRAAHRQLSISVGNLLLLFGWAVVTFFWTFTRDTNAYSLPLLAIGILIGILWKKNYKICSVIGMFSVVFLLGLFVFQQYTFRLSQRWLVPVVNNMVTNVFPHSTRVAFFEKRGMPVSPDLIAIRGSMEYNEITEFGSFMDWVKQNGLSAYSNFLLDNPRWAVQSFIHHIQFGFSENLQPYFVPRAHERPAWAIPYGNLLHSTSSSIILIYVLMLIALLWSRTSKASEIVWNGLLIWLFVISLALMFFGYHGEVRSVLRHMMAGVIPMRLAIWLVSVKVVDRMACLV
jgi:hypothetical protein